MKRFANAMAGTAFVAAALLCAAAHATPYTWTGGGAAGNWNDPLNWSPSTGVPNAGDKATFDLSATLAITSDIALSAGTLTISNNGAAVSFTGVISGAGGLELRGNKGIELKGDNTFEGGVFRNSFLSYVDLYHENGLGRGKFTACDGAAANSGKSGSTPLRILSQSLTVPNDMEFGQESCVSWNGSIYFKYSATFTGAIRFKSQTRFGDYGGGTFEYIRFKNTVTATDCLVVQNIGARAIYYEKAPVGGKFHCDAQHSPKIHFMEGGGNIQVIYYSGTSYPTYYMDADDVLNSSSFVCFNSYRGKIDLNGHSQTVGYIYDNGIKSQTGRCVTNSSDTAATLTMKPKANYMFGGTFDGKMSLVYSPDTAARTYTISNSVSTMSGAITVEKGTLQIKHGTSFLKLSGLSVASGAAFKILDVASTVAQSRDSAIPLTLGDATAKLSLPDGYRFWVDSITVEGSPLPYGTYAARATAPANTTPVDWIDGEGLVVYAPPSGTIVWTGAGGDSLASNPANWVGLSEPPDFSFGSLVAVFPADAEAFTATFPAGMSRLGGIVMGATNFTFAAADATSVLGVGSDGIVYERIEGAERTIKYDISLAPIDMQEWAADDEETTSSLKIVMSRPFVDDPLGLGNVTVTGGGRYDFHTTNSTYTGDIKIDRPVPAGKAYAYGNDPFGPAGTLIVVPHDYNSWNLYLTDVTTSKKVIARTDSGNRRRPIAWNSGMTVFKGLFLSEGVDAMGPRGTTVFAGGYGDSLHANYVNWGAGGIDWPASAKVIVTNVPFYVGTIQATITDLRLYAPSNYFNGMAAWNGTYSPVGMTANIHFYTNFAFYRNNVRCAITGDSVWDFHGTEQTIGSLNGTGGATGGMISTNGPGRLNVRQTVGWESLAKSQTGLIDFWYNGRFKGEMSLSLTGTKRLILRQDSTATGCVDVAESAILCFTNNTSWASATNVAVRANGKIEAWNDKVLGRYTDLTLADSGVYEFCGAGPYIQKVRFLWLDGRRRKTGDFNAENSGGRIVGNGIIRVMGDGRGAVLVFK